MANAKVQSSVQSMMYNGRNSLLPPKCPFPVIHPSAIAPNALPKPREGYRYNHNRTSSESFLIEEQPSWLDELLSEPETPVRKNHRRASSDSLAYLEGNMNCVAQDDNNFKKSIPVPAWGSQKSSFCAVINCSSKVQNGISFPKDDNLVLDGGSLNASEELSSANDSSQAKYYETDPKRAKQQFAQRSRVRKLQYIAELERNVQVLLAEGSGIAAELEFVNQQNIILSMENKALKQRLENLSQEQLIKCFEHEVLERELGRLRNLYKHQQLQPPQQHMSSSHRRSKSRDIDHQFANLSLKPNNQGSNATVMCTW